MGKTLGKLALRGDCTLEQDHERNRRIIIFSENNIKAILFDLDGTLRYNKPSSLHFYLDCAVRLGVEDSLERRRQAIRWAHYYWAHPKHLKENLRLYNERNEQFWCYYSIQYLISYGCSPKQAKAVAPEANRMMISEYSPKDCVPDDVFQALGVLKNHGFQLAVVTNRLESCQRQLESLGLYPYFELTVVGGEVNSWKPDEEIYTYALKRLQISPREAIFIGDNYFTDIVGAKRVGISPVLIDPEGIFQNAECPTISNMGELLSLF